jgi:hypothetical protein
LKIAKHGAIAAEPKNYRRLKKFTQSVAELPIRGQSRRE